MLLLLIRLAVFIFLILVILNLLNDTFDNRKAEEERNNARSEVDYTKRPTEEMEFFRSENVQKPENAIKVYKLAEKPEEYYLKKKLIEEWVNQCLSSKSRPNIKDWDFYGSSDKISFMLSEDDFIYHGEVHYKLDGLKHVSSVIYTDKDGRKRRFSGYKLPEFKDEELIRRFRISRKDSSNLEYFNKVASDAIQNGKAVFNILDYKDITEEEFASTFGKKEQRAFRKFLLEDFAEVNQGNEEYCFEVTPLLENN